MKLKEIISRIDTSKKDEYVNLAPISSEFDINDVLNSDGRLQSYFFHKWYCGDTYVGWRAYFLDDECVCVSSQIGRKWDEEFEWISEELYRKIHQYLLSLMEKDGLHSIKLADLNEELGEGQQIEFSEQFLTEKVIYITTGERVRIIDTFRKEIISKKLKIMFEDGTESVVPTSSVLVPYSIKPA